MDELFLLASWCVVLAAVGVAVKALWARGPPGDCTMTLDLDTWLLREPDEIEPVECPACNGEGGGRDESVWCRCNLCDGAGLVDPREVEVNHDDA